MLRSLADNLYSKNGAVKWLKNKFPEEEIVFASAATLLETKDVVPAGWSLRRLFQHRGVVIITRTQLIFKTSLLSFSAILYILILILSFVLLFRYHDWDYLLPTILFGILTAQFLPFQKQIPRRDIRRVKLGMVRGLFSKGSLLTVYGKNKVFNIVPAQLLREDVIEVISPKKKV
jgi:hypothetical protein